MTLPDDYFFEVGGFLWAFLVCAVAGFAVALMVVSAW